MLWNTDACMCWISIGWTYLARCLNVQLIVFAGFKHVLSFYNRLCQPDVRSKSLEFRVDVLRRNTFILLHTHQDIHTSTGLSYDSSVICSLCLQPSVTVRRELMSLYNSTTQACIHLFQSRFYMLQMFKTTETLCGKQKTKEKNKNVTPHWNVFISILFFLIEIIN